MESCRSVFLAILYSVMTLRCSGALWQVAVGCLRTRPLRTLDSCSPEKSTRRKRGRAKRRRPPKPPTLWKGPTKVGNQEG